MTHTKVRITITVDPEVLDAGKRIAGLIPLSRWIESLMKREIAEADQ